MPNNMIISFLRYAFGANWEVKINKTEQVCKLKEVINWMGRLFQNINWNRRNFYYNNNNAKNWAWLKWTKINNGKILQWKVKIIIAY
jgi:hypothetical protein